MGLYDAKVQDILANAERCHDAFLQAETFGGPSLYFHQRALATRTEPASDTHLECVYATLASWGMHRMGQGGSKMRPFDAFRASVRRMEGDIRAAQALTPEGMTEEGWSLLGGIFLGLDIMASRTRLVGNSKVMHHMIPGLVPPIDREYTLRYLKGNTNIANDPAAEWRTMRSMIEGFFVPVALDAAFAARAAGWVADAGLQWDSSPMKVVDNLIIGARKVSGSRGR